MRAVGFWSAGALCAVGVIYAAVLAVGFAKSGLSQPIVDPILAIMEVITLLSAPVIVIMMSEVHGYAGSEDKSLTRVALGFAILMAGLTCSVHFVALTAGRQMGLPGLRWPSIDYALELLAWDVFLGLSFLFAAPVFRGSRLHNVTRWGMLITGILCILGTIGPAVGNMRWQLIGVLGYAGVLPFTSFALALVFRRSPEQSPPRVLT